MLSLEVARGHERVRLDRFRRKLAALLYVVLVDDLKRERVENYLFEILVDARGVIGRDQAHLFREREVEKEDTTIRAVTRLIIDITIRTNVSPGMSAVYLLELLIHTQATKRHKNRHKGF